MISKLTAEQAQQHADAHNDNPKVQALYQQIVDVMRDNELLRKTCRTLLYAIQKRGDDYFDEEQILLQKALSSNKPTEDK